MWRRTDFRIEKSWVNLKARTLPIFTNVCHWKQWKAERAVVKIESVHALINLQEIWEISHRPYDWFRNLNRFDKSQKNSWAETNFSPINLKIFFPTKIIAAYADLNTIKKVLIMYHLFETFFLLFYFRRRDPSSHADKWCWCFSTFKFFIINFIFGN